MERYKETNTGKKSYDDIFDELFERLFRPKEKIKKIKLCKRCIKKLLKEE